MSPIVALLSAVLLFALFYFGFPETRRNLFSFWSFNRKAVEIPTPTGPESITTFVPLFLLKLSAVNLAMAMYRISGGDGHVGSPPMYADSITITLVLYWAAAIIEESLFRGIPLLFVKGVKRFFGVDWIFAIGIVSSVAFAAVHLLNIEGSEVSLRNLMLVTPQFIGGLVYWWGANRYGVHTTIAWHFTWNAIMIFAAMF